MTQTYNYTDIPQYDKQRLLPYKNKADFINAYPRYLTERSDENEVFFITCTFKNKNPVFNNSNYESYFRYARQNLDTKLIRSRKKDFDKRPILTLIPEASPYQHYHGLLLIHKSTIEKFRQKVIVSSDPYFCEALYRQCVSYNFHHRIFTQPYPKRIMFEQMQAAALKEIPKHRHSQNQKNILRSTKPLLRHYSSRIFKLETNDDIERCFTYSVKNFLKSHYTTDDLIFEAKPNTFQNV